MKRVSNQVTYRIAKYRGDSFPFYYVSEFPRSGGTWVAHMLADYLQLSFPKNSIFPLGHSCVIHNHWNYSRKLQNPVYVVRDGRDVAVSMMFYVLKNSKENLNKKKYYKKRYPKCFEYPLSKYGEKVGFRHFLPEWMKIGAGTKLDWNKHVRQWVFNENIIVVKYEDFNRNCFDALRNLLNRLGHNNIDEDLLNWTIQKFSFNRQTGRKIGQSDLNDNKRKGIIGDWKNYFDKELAYEFHKYAGALLLELGYEKDEEWYKKLST